MSQPKITALIHTWNEEYWIEKCIRSVLWADEVVVADMQSTDRTVDIAKSLGARVLTMPKREYNVEALRNDAVAACDDGWIIIVDADETIAPTLPDKLRALASAPTAAAYSLPRRNYFLGKWLEHTFWPDYQPRFIRKGFARWDGEAHHHPIIDGKLEELPASPDSALEHWGYCHDLNRYLIKTVSYTRLVADQLVRNGTISPWPYMVRRPLGEFYSRYFKDNGWKDGMSGLVMCLILAIYQTLIAIHIWAMTRQKHPEIPPAHLRRQVRWEALRSFTKWVR